MKRKLFALATVLAFSLALLAGCGGGGDGSTAAEGGGSGGGEAAAGGSAGGDKVVLMGSAYSLPEQEAAWNSVAEAFTAETGIEVEYRRQGTWDEIPQALQAAKLSGEQIDLVVVGIGTVRATLGPAGNTMDITDLMADLMDRFPDGMIESCYIGDRLWAFPFSDGSGTTFLYNKTMFEELGLDTPETFDDLIQISNTIRSEKGITPMTFHGKDTWGWPMFFFDTYAQTTDNNSVTQVEEFLRGNYEFTGQQEQEAILLIKELFDEGVMDLDVLDTDSDGMRAVFAQEQAAMMFCGTWEIPVLDSMDLPFEMGAFMFPAMFDGAKPQHAYAVGDGAIQIPSFIDEDNLENTMRFIEFLTRPENAKAILTAGENPIFEVVKGAIGETDELKTFLNENLVSNSVMYLDWVWPAEINDQFCQVIPAVISGNMSAEDAVDSVQNAYSVLLKEKEYSYDWWSDWTDEDWAKVRPASIPDISQYKQ